MDHIDAETGEITRALTIPTPDELQRYTTDEALIALTEQMLEFGKRELASLTDLETISDQRAKLLAYDRYLAQTIRDCDLKIEARNNLAELVLRYQRAIGRMLKTMPKNKGAATRYHDDTASPPTLADLNVTKLQSSRWQQQAAKLTDEEFDDTIATVKENHWELSSYDLDKNIMQAQATKQEARRDEKREQAQALAPDVYNVIYADPAWEYSNTGLNGAAEHHYDTLPIEAIYGLPQEIGLCVADHAVLFLWVTNPLLIEGLECIRRWGFEYKTHLVWVKTELIKPGVGWYVRGRHELLMIATRGSFTPLDEHLSPPIGSVLEAPIREHSRKPEEVYTIIERLYPQCSYIELFARHAREGWSAWGDELHADE